jgi:hypothetical protein
MPPLSRPTSPSLLICSSHALAAPRDSPRQHRGYGFEKMSRPSRLDDSENYFVSGHTTGLAFLCPKRPIGCKSNKPSIRRRPPIRHALVFHLANGGAGFSVLAWSDKQTCDRCQQCQLPGRFARL